MTRENTDGVYRPWRQGGLFDEITLERKKQVGKGYTPEHDDTHTHGDIGIAAACYATPAWARATTGVEWLMFGGAVRPREWPWNPLSWRPEPGDRKAEIVTAMALLTAEYERIERAEDE